MRIIKSNEIPSSRRSRVSWKQAAVLVVVFMAGGLAGAMLATNLLHARMQYFRENPDALARSVLPRLEYLLNLNEEQSEEIRDIVSRRHKQIVLHSRQGAQGMHAEFATMESEVAALLDQRQALKWAKIAQSIRSSFLPDLGK